MKKILLLHGAAGSARQLDPLKQALAKDFEVYSINFSGHGGLETTAEFSIKLFAQDVLSWLKEKGIAKIVMFGYSMGGYVALYLAKHFPDTVDSVITLAAKLSWNEETAAKEVKMLQADVIEQKLPQFAAQLKESHYPGDWKNVLSLTGKMLVQLARSNPLSQEDFQQIESNVLLMIGDRDKMVTFEETVAAYKHLPNAQLSILPNTPHPIERVDVQLLSFLLNKFLK